MLHLGIGLGNHKSAIVYAGGFRHIDGERHICAEVTMWAREEVHTEVTADIGV